MSTNFYSHAKKKNHPSLQESLNAAKHFFGGLNLFRFNKDFLSKKKIVVTNLCIPSQSQYEVVMNLIWFTV